MVNSPLYTTVGMIRNAFATFLIQWKMWGMEVFPFRLPSSRTAAYQTKSETSCKLPHYVVH